MEKSIYIIKYTAYATGAVEIDVNSFTSLNKAINEKRALKACGHTNIQIIETKLITE